MDSEYQVHRNKEPREKIAKFSFIKDSERARVFEQTGPCILRSIGAQAGRRISRNSQYFCLCVFHELIRLNVAELGVVLIAFGVVAVVVGVAVRLGRRFAGLTRPSCYSCRRFVSRFFSLKVCGCGVARKVLCRRRRRVREDPELCCIVPCVVICGVISCNKMPPLPQCSVIFFPRGCSDRQSGETAPELVVEIIQFPMQ